MAKSSKGKGAAEKQASKSERRIAENRRARREYEITDTLECGIVLVGSEVKSLRDGKVSLEEAYGRASMCTGARVSCTPPALSSRRRVRR